MGTGRPAVRNLATMVAPPTQSHGGPEIPEGTAASGGPSQGVASQNLMQAGARGTMWLGVAQIVGKAVLAVTTIILARLLTPHEFGLVSLSLVLIVYADAISDAGVGQAMVYLSPTRTMTRAALLCSMVSGAVIVAAAWAAAPLIAAFFHEPEVIPLVRLLATGLFASSLAALPVALLRRELQFKRITIAAFFRTIVTGVVSVGLAFAGYGAWSLAWGSVLGGFTYLAGTWLLTPDRPDLLMWRTTREDVRAVYGYGMPVAGNTLLTRLLFDVDYLVVGRILGATALGYYTLAFRLPELLIINVFFILSAVAFPLYNSVRHDAGRLSGGYLISLRIFSLYGMVTGVGLAVAAPLVIPALFGAKWHAAVAPLVGLGLYAACRAIGGGAAEVYKAMGRPGLSVWLSIIRLVVLVPALLLAAKWWGIIGVAWAQVATSLLFAVMLQAVAVRVLRLSWPEMGRALLPSFVAAAAVAIVGVPLARLPVPPLAALVVVAIGGSVAAAASLRIAFPAVFQELLSLLGRRAARKPARVS